jgi:hypothetical protein
MAGIELVEAESLVAGLPVRALRALQRGVVIPAHPLALDASRRMDERRQRALSRYYVDAGVGGLAVGVHTTQFEIRDPRIGLFRPVLEIAAEEMDRADHRREEPLVRIGGICGSTASAVDEAVTLRDLGYHAGLLNLGALVAASDDVLIDHCRAVADVIPVVGFYLQPGSGGRPLGYRFWRRLVELPGVIAIKVAPFNRYRTIDVVRAVVESGRDDIALYTGNDDNIVMDLLTPHRFLRAGRPIIRRFVGGLLGHWSVWTRAAVHVLEQCHRAVRSEGPIEQDMLTLAIEVTDCNAAVFDTANGFAGSTAGIHEILRRQGLLEGTWCLATDRSTLSPGQARELDRVHAAYPHLVDDAFVAANLDRWMNG